MRSLLLGVPMTTRVHGCARKQMECRAEKMVSSGLETRNGPNWSFIDRKIVRYEKDGLSRTRHQIGEYAQLSIPPK